MNSKGFTLIEILVVVVILGMLGVVVTMSLTKMLNNTRQNDCERFVLEIEDAACVYAGLKNKKIACNRNNCSPIPLEILVSEGLVNFEKDACTGNDIDLRKTVSVSWDENGEKSCHYNGVREYER